MPLRVLSSVCDLNTNLYTSISNAVNDPTWLLQTEAHTGTRILADFVAFFLTSLVHFLHSYSLTVFSPSGKLVQIEHALAAVSSGTTSLGIKGLPAGTS